MTAYFSVNRYEKFQHYRDRRPAWIKVYTDLLDDFDFTKLPDNKKSQLMCIWILASKLENRVPLDNKWVAIKICCNTVLDLDFFMDKGWLVPYDESAAADRFDNWESRYISKKVREQVLERDGYKCCECGATERLEIGRLDPPKKGQLDPENEEKGVISTLLTICASCNRRRRAKTTSYEKKKSMEQHAPQKWSLEGYREEEDKKEGMRTTDDFFEGEFIRSTYVRECLAIWNELMEPYAPKIKPPLSESRKKHLSVRVREQLDGITGWRDYLVRITRSDFLTGRKERSDEHRNWKPNFDWAIRRSSCDKVLEGTYDNEGYNADDENKTLTPYKKALLKWHRGGKEGPAPKKEDYEKGDDDDLFP